MGLNQRIASGIPISEEASVRAGIRSSRTAAATSAGRRRLSQTDLSLFQDIRFGGTKLQFGVTVLNLFDRDAVTRRWTTTGWSATCRSPREQFFAGGCNYEALLAANPTPAGRSSGRRTSIQAPREVRFTVKSSSDGGTPQRRPHGRAREGL